MCFVLCVCVRFVVRRRVCTQQRRPLVAVEQSQPQKYRKLTGGAWLTSGDFHIWHWTLHRAKPNHTCLFCTLILRDVSETKNRNPWWLETRGRGLVLTNRDEPPVVLRCTIWPIFAPKWQPAISTGEQSHFRTGVPSSVWFMLMNIHQRAPHHRAQRGIPCLYFLLYIYFPPLCSLLTQHSVSLGRGFAVQRQKLKLLSFFFFFFHFCLIPPIFWKGLPDQSWLRSRRSLDRERTLVSGEARNEDVLVVGGWVGGWRGRWCADGCVAVEFQREKLRVVFRSLRLLCFSVWTPKMRTVTFSTPQRTSTCGREAKALISRQLCRDLPLLLLFNEVLGCICVF